MELDRPHHRATPSTSSNAANNELFICFTSRLSSSSSSMKIAKSILSPGRGRDPPISLSTSLSRRLRTNGSIKGGLASPMFPSVGKKRGCGFDNPEPSSPKVTCIGQVRVKTKKKVKQTRSLSRRRSGEVSFRKVEQQSHDSLKNIEEIGFSGAVQQKSVLLNSSSSHLQQPECLPHRNQRWVHLPVTVCEALGCLFPCRSSCFSNSEKEKEKGNVVGREESEVNNNNGGSSCGAVFARWFVSLQDCEGGKAREIELVMGGGDEEKTEVRERISMRSSRRHVFEDMEFKEEILEVKGEGDEEEEKARVSICIPPKNALLLMRCRSDPMKMDALANRFWESPAPTKDEDEEEEGEEEEALEVNKDLKQVLFQVSELMINEATVDMEGLNKELVSTESYGEAGNSRKDANLAAEMEEIDDNVEKDANLAAATQESIDEEVQENANLVAEVQEFGVEELEEKLNNNEELETGEDMLESEEAESNLDAFEDLLEEGMPENKGENPIQWLQVEQVEEEARTTQIDALFSPERATEQSVKEATESSIEGEEENDEETDKSTFEDVEEEIPEALSFEENEENPTTTLFTSEFKDGENDKIEEKEEQNQETNDVENEETEEHNEGNQAPIIVAEEKDEEKENTSTVLPDCLLLMMCEPKLSMEVSKETWVCSTDFIRWLPERPERKKVNPPEEEKKRVSTESNPLIPPPQQRREVTPQQQLQERRHQQQQQQHAFQPPRSSCSLPPGAAASMAAMIEQKLANAVGCEPFVLTRCKSEPMRTAAAKLTPEACFWKNRKLEPHRNAAVGVGAAGVGF